MKSKAKSQKIMEMVFRLAKQKRFEGIDIKKITEQKKLTRKPE